MLTRFPGKVDHLVSLGCKGAPLPEGWENISPEDKLRLVFDDVNTPENAYGLWDAPTKLDVLKLLRFIRERSPQGHWLFHCRMGISRSSACAIVMLAAVFPNHPPKEILKEVVKARPQADPNRLILAHADEILGYGGSLVNVARSH